MQESNVTVTFGAIVGDQADLSKRSRLTLEAMYRHPLTHNLEWRDVIALFDALGTVEYKSNSDVVLAIGDEHHQVPRSHSKDLAAGEVMGLRHILTRAGWAPLASGQTDVALPRSTKAATLPESLDLLVVVDHHEARLYRLDIRSVEKVDHVIRPYDPHRFLHHLSQKDKSRERGQKTPEDQQFYQQIARSLVDGARIVLVGHGKGHSNAADHLAKHLAEHDPATSQRVVNEVVADLSSVTEPQLLDLGQRALTI